MAWVRRLWRICDQTLCGPSTSVSIGSPNRATCPLANRRWAASSRRKSWCALSCENSPVGSAKSLATSVIARTDHTTMADDLRDWLIERITNVIVHHNVADYGS